MRRTVPASFDIEAFLKKFQAESDRACAVLGGALLDVRLEQLFRSKFVQGNKKTFDELLDPSGPVGSFATRIKLSYALGLIDSDVHSDLRIIRDLRNDFAHHLDVGYSFKSGEVTDRCNNLLAARTLIEGHRHAKANPAREVSDEIIDKWIEQLNSPRSRFEMSVHLIAQRLELLAVASKPPLGFLDDIRRLGESSARPFKPGRSE